MRSTVSFYYVEEGVGVVERPTEMEGRPAGGDDDGGDTLNLHTM